MEQKCRLSFCCISAILITGIVICSFWNLESLKEVWSDWTSVDHSQTIDLEAVEFNNYLVKFNKSYSGREYRRRLRIFKASLAEISRLNALEGDTVFGLTQFSDMSAEELFQSSFGNVRGKCIPEVRQCKKKNQEPHLENEIPLVLDNLPIPDKFDWRKEGYVSPVVDQKLCYGCWAICLVGVMETMAAKANISSEPLSIQELMDCSIYNNGCDYGSVHLALNFICDYSLGIVPAEKYPLTLKNGTCLVPSGDAVTVKNFTYHCLMDETDILRLVVHHGPVTTIVNGASWPNYIGGIIRRACVRGKDSRDHAVEIVGYDLTGAIPYYIVKNSWGALFGEDGYVKVALYENVCGIREEIASINVKKMSYN